MRVKSWHVRRGLWLAVIVAGVLVAGPASPAESEVEDYDAEDCREVADAHHGRGEYEEALEWYDRALALEPEDPKFYVGKASALYKLGRLEEIVDAFDCALALWPDDWFMQSMKGLAFWAQNRREKAVESFDRALELYDGGYPSVLRDYDVGEGEVKATISLVHIGKAEVLYELGRHEEAVESFDRALALRPDDWPLLYEKRELLVELGRLEEALSAKLARISELEKRIDKLTARYKAAMEARDEAIAEEIAEEIEKARGDERRRGRR